MRLSACLCARVCVGRPNRLSTSEEECDSGCKRAVYKLSRKVTGQDAKDSDSSVGIPDFSSALRTVPAPLVSALIAWQCYRFPLLRIQGLHSFHRK